MISEFLFSENINIYLQSFGNPFIDDLFLAITTAGSLPAYFFLASLVLWCFGKKTGIRAMYLVLFSAFAAIFAKNLFSMPRPPEYLHKIEENEFGFPSGHALVSAGFWSYLSCVSRNSWLIFAGVVAVLSVSLSRIYLGVHYAGDVLGGIILGVLLAFIVFKAESKVIKKLEKLSRISRYFAAIIIPAILIAVASIQRALLEEQALIGLVMAGTGLGYLMEEERIRFEDAKNNRQRITRAVTGTAVSGAVYLFSEALLLINPDFMFFKYTALGFTSTFIVPWVITKMEVKNQR